MQFNYKFGGDSRVSNSASSTEMSFSPDVKRDPAFFNGLLSRHIPFREAISALHDIVVSDFRFKPRDKSDYKAWAAQQESIWLAEYLKESVAVEAKVKDLREQLSDVRKKKDELMGPFYKARKTYFDHIYKSDRDMWIVLDPIITIHPDEIFFECFSQDESSYGKLGCDYNIFSNVNEFKCGTTNIDYSSALYDEFQKIRSYKDTRFIVDPSGFEVQTSHEESFKEVKIDVPDSWVRGLLQVSSAMTLPATTISFHPMDIYNMCFILKRKKEKQGPRSIVFKLKPGQPVKMIFQPWNIELECPRSLYEGHEEKEIRVWGRRRILLLERLVPVTKRFKVVLLGSGLPSFYIAEMDGMNFTLGLSGWTNNDWAQNANFDLLAPRAEADAMTMQRVFTGLKQDWLMGAETLSKKIGTDKKLVLGALSAFTQAGKVIYDLNKNVYRVRELSQEALPIDSLRFSNPREESAVRLTDAKAIVMTVAEVAKGLQLYSEVNDKGRKYTASVLVDFDERIINAQCTCSFYQYNKLHKGPCEHILATRLEHRNKKTLVL